ncbi:Spliceosomal protein DIB1, partial [Pseudozyma hubeiensis]
KRVCQETTSQAPTQSRSHVNTMGRKAEVQRMLLTKLMGPEAMGAPSANLHFTDPKVCRNFLCGTCPHDLFANTKVDLGPCPKSHTPKYKDEYRKALAAGQRFPEFEREHEHNIFSFISDIDRKIAANKRRLEQTPEELARFANMNREISEIETALAAVMAEVEALGEQGQIEESLAELAKADALKEEKAQKEKELHNAQENSGASGHQKLRVCDVCGAYLSILDSDRRDAREQREAADTGADGKRGGEEGEVKEEEGEVLSDYKPNPRPPIQVKEEDRKRTRGCSTMSYFLPHLPTGWHVDQAILSEEDRVVILRFGRDTDPVCMEMDETLYKISTAVQNFAVIYLVDITQVPDFNKMYELYDACSTMFFYRNKHIMIDLGTGNNNKINWAITDRQELIDIVEVVYRGASKGRGLVISPKDYSTRQQY